MASEEAVERYLDDPPYYGRSHPRDCATVKRLAGATRKFDYERKLWATRCTDALRALVASKKWQPAGISKEAHALLMRKADAHRARAEAEWKAKEEARRAREEEERQQRAVAEAIHRSKKKAREAEAAVAEIKAKRQKRMAAAKAAAVLPFASKAAALAAAKPPAKRRDGIEPSQAEGAECARLGFTEAAVAFSQSLDELGPRGSLSDEGRVLRYCGLAFEHAEGARELTREERSRSWGGREVRWALPEAASREYAEQLNRRAKEAAAEREV